MEFLLLLGILVGGGLLAWGLGGRQPAATLVGTVLLVLSLLSGLRVRLSPAFLTAVSAVVLLGVGILVAVRREPTPQAPDAAQQASATPATAAPTPGAVEVPSPLPTGEALVALGQRLAAANGCVACHFTDGRRLTGPTWEGLFGSTEQLQGGRVQVDEEYLRESIRNPNAKVVQGFAPIMPQFSLSDAQMEALTSYIKSLR